MTPLLLPPLHVVEPKVDSRRDDGVGPVDVVDEIEIRIPTTDQARLKVAQETLRLENLVAPLLRAHFLQALLHENSPHALELWLFDGVVDVEPGLDVLKEFFEASLFRGVNAKGRVDGSPDGHEEGLVLCFGSLILGVLPVIGPFQKLLAPPHAVNRRRGGRAGRREGRLVRKIILPAQD